MGRIGNKKDKVICQDNETEKIIPSIEEIELAIMNNRDFYFRQNLMVFRVSDFSGIVNHECDCLIMSKTGYLTEIEIKRSYSDFLADFKKKHKHDDERISKFYFMVHTSFADKVFEKLIKENMIPQGIYTYDDNTYIKLYKTCADFKNKILNEDITYYRSSSPRKLFIEEKYQLARLGAMRYKNMTEKLIKKEKINEFRK